MSNLKLRFAAIAFVAIGLAACGENEEKRAAAAPQSTGAPIAQSSTKVYGREDAECFAGIVRSADARHISPADFKNWQDKLNSKDKDWLSGFSDSYAIVARVINANMGKTPQELYESKLITMQQLAVIEGYLNVYQENDASKANFLSASACTNVGFTKGTDLN